MRQECPYHAQPAAAFWRAAVAGVPRHAVDPTTPARFPITPQTVVASAGSCFAQHIRNQLVRREFNYLITEPGPADLFEDERLDRNYGVFPARFGNVYTTPQLAQLLERAYGRFTPAEDHWSDDGRVYDPVRPFVEPDGFASLAELEADRERHLAATRAMFEDVEVFIFTLGLTETWCDRRDGTVFPTCPGCAIGRFDPQRHVFVNLGVDQTRSALFSFIERFHDVNPGAKIILTVSPVPLLATMTDRHVLQATTYSKAVLRIVAEEARAAFDHVDYFPSYEIITATQRTHVFFAGDGRTVTPAGVERAMDLFFHMYAGIAAPVPEPADERDDPGPPLDLVICDEETMLAGAT